MNDKYGWLTYSFCFFICFVLIFLLLPPSEWGWYFLLLSMGAGPLLMVAMHYSRIPSSLMRIFGNFLIFCTFFMYFGNGKAVEDLGITVGPSQIVLVQGVDINNVVILRELDKGLLIRLVSENRIAFLPWAAVKYLDVRQIDFSRQNRICKWFDLRCEKL